MESALDYHTAKALLDWHIELGADEALCEAPVDRYALAVAQAASKAAAAERAPAQAHVVAAKTPEVDPVAVAEHAAKSAQDLPALATALQGFELCGLKKGARQLVFGDGQAAPARVMVIGGAPSREDDRLGRPFSGPDGGLLDKMLAAIDLDRTASEAHQAVYLTYALPWRPPQNMDPSKADLAMMLPFLQRHVELVQPDVLVLMGNVSCQMGLGRSGIARLRGQWGQAFGLPVLPMYAPADLRRNTRLKRDAWADLLALKAKLSAPA